MDETPAPEAAPRSKPDRTHPRGAAGAAAGYPASIHAFAPELSRDDPADGTAQIASVGRLRSSVAACARQRIDLRAFDIHFDVGGVFVHKRFIERRTLHRHRAAR